MQHPLYARPFDGRCFYCLEGEVSYEPFLDASLPVPAVELNGRCRACDRVFTLGLTPTSLTLEQEGGGTREFVLPHEILDQGAEDPRAAPPALVGVVVAVDGLCVLAAGHGDALSAPGYGCPLIVEQFHGSLRAIHWTDINAEDAQCVVDLDGAQESRRAAAPDGSDHYRARLLAPDGLPVEEHAFDEPATAIDWAESRLAGIPGHRAIVIDSTAERTVLWDSHTARAR